MKKIISLILSVSILAAAVSCSNKEKAENVVNNTAQYISEYSYYNNGTAYTLGDLQNYTKTFLDFDSMEKAPLCAVPNCTHTTASCLSKSIGFFYKPVFYNEYVYYFVSNGGAVKETPDGPEFYINSSLMRASFDSSEVEMVCEFNDGVPCEDGKYVLYNNELFFIADDRGASQDDFGHYDFGTTGGNFFICSINLDTREFTNYGNIYEEDKEYEASEYTRSSNIYGVYNGKMYISHSFVKDQSSDRNADDYWTFINFEFDFETRKWKEAELPASPFMNDDCYIYYDYDDKKIKAIYQEGDYEFDLGFNMRDFRDSHCSELNGKLFFPSIGKWFDLTDMSEHSMGEYAEYSAVAYYDESYIFVKGGKTIKLTEEELTAL